MNFSKLILVLIAFSIIIIGCQKESIQDIPSAPTEEFAPRSLEPNGKLELTSTPVNVMIEINKEISKQWNDDYFTSIYNELGFISIEKSHYKKVNDESYLVSIPVIKKDIVNGIILFYKDNGNYTFKLYTKDIFRMPFKKIEQQIDNAFSLFILSSFSNHQYFHNGQVSNFQSFLKDYFEFINHNNRNFVFIEYCDLITVGSAEEVFHSYIDCYTVVEYIHGTGPGVGNTNEDDHNDPSKTFPESPNIPGGGGSPTSDEPKGFPNASNYEPDEFCKEQINGQLLAYINNQLNFILPCDEESPVQIRDQIMDGLCQNNPFITISDFLARLDNYNWVNLNGSAEEIQLMVENLPSECKSIFPLSCESFNFEDVGLFQISRLIGESLTLIILDPMDPRNREILDCPYKIQLNAPFSAVIFGVNYEVSSGMAANAAANALNSAAQETLSEYGRNLECEEAINTLINKLNTYFVQELGEVVAESYGLNPNISYVDFEITPEANLEFDNIFNVEPTNRVSDISILTFFKDDCR